MKRYGILAALAYVALASAAIWLGGLNQDEGWYLYAAQLVGEGKTLYRDFFYTQGPLMPILYAPLADIWRAGGLLAARVLTCGIGLAGLVFAVALARLLAPDARRGAAGLVAFLLLGCNLYHVYYTAIPKTYALASLFVLMGYYLLFLALKMHARAEASARAAALGRLLLFAAGLSLAFAAGTRISLGALLAVCGFGLLAACRSLGLGFVWFGLGGLVGLALVYGPFLCDDGARAGLCAAQAYHAARGGRDFVFTVGSLSRLVRWYLPVFALLAWGVLRRGEGPAADAAAPRLPRILLALGFLAVFAVQMVAPFPYEDYQVPVMGLLAVLAAASAARPGMGGVPLALVLAFATSFGSPLLEKWKTNGQDRFWSLKKERSELAQLQDTARAIECLDPGGKELLTQDLYLAVETGRRVPAGLEMGPFSMLDDAGWVKLLSTVDCPIAAMSGYSFAVNPPRCDERPLAEQIKYWDILRKRYELVFPEERFGQNATTLLILKRRAPAAEGGAAP